MMQIENWWNSFYIGIWVMIQYFDSLCHRVTSEIQFSRTIFKSFQHCIKTAKCSRSPDSYGKFSLPRVRTIVKESCASGARTAVISLFVLIVHLSYSSTFFTLISAKYYFFTQSHQPTHTSQEQWREENRDG